MELLRCDCTDAGDDPKNKKNKAKIKKLEKPCISSHSFLFGDCYCFLKNLPIQKLGISFNLVLRVITTKPIRFQIL